jgi:hypothetical protein
MRMDSDSNAARKASTSQGTPKPPSKADPQLLPIPRLTVLDSLRPSGVPVDAALSPGC